MKITAAVVRNSGGPFLIENLEIDEPQRGEVLVRIVGTGLCHTDLVVRDQVLPTPLPAVLGHEGAGIVERVGAGVTRVSPGDHVVLGFASCGHCPNCREHQPGYCIDFSALNFGGCRQDGSVGLHTRDGERVSSNFFGQSSFASHALINETNVVKVSAGAPLELLGPLGCGILTGAGAVFNSLGAQAGNSLGIFGGGPVGLSAVLAGATRACAPIIVVEPMASRRSLALQLGATHAIDPGAGDVTTVVRDVIPTGLRYALDTTGMPSVIETAVHCMSTRSTLGTVGVPKSLDLKVSFNVVQMLSLGISIKGITEGDSDPQVLIPQLVELYLAGRLPFDRMITRYPLSQINEAVADQIAGKCVKAVLAA
jgi:aryl-alcohol dehydrogenase